jgi:hypothetical protein
MKLGTHDIVGVAGEDGQAGPGLPVPNANGLIIGGGEDPGEFVVKKDGADVVQVSVESKETALELPVPDFDFVVVSTRDKERLGGMKVHASHGA